MGGEEMKELEKLIEQEPDEIIAKDLKLALYLYKDLLTNNNKKILDEYTSLLLNVLKKKGYAVNKKDFSNAILENFYNYLIKSRKTKSTSYDYTKRVERICKEYNIAVDDLYNRKSAYSINDLIGMYSAGGIKSEENRAKHNALLSALKQFQAFMENFECNFENDNFYLCDTEGYQSWEIINKHPYIVEIKGRKCEITYKENRMICDKVSKIIDDINYNELINVFRKYKNILSVNTVPAFKSCPFGGVHSYSYRFEDKSNDSSCATLFESNNRVLTEQAYEDYHKALNNIINQ